MDTGTGHRNGSTQAASSLGWTPATEDERAAVAGQLERLLASPYFRNSRKYPAFLRYIVEHTLHGQADHIKERTLGVEVFARQPDYDTAADPVVRIVAAEVRKRIGQYYHESAAPGEILIDLPSGSYVPRFGHPEAPGTTTPFEPAGPQTQFRETEPAGRREPRPGRLRASLRSRYVLALLGLAILVAAGVWLLRPRPSVLDLFWTPILEAPGTITIITGGGASWMPQAAGANPLSVEEQQSRDLIAYSDATAVASLAGILLSTHKPYLIRPSAMIDLPQLRTGSALLVGAFNNPWTLRLTSPLRFVFDRDLTNRTNWIQDRKNPAMRSWKIVTTTPFPQVTEDWAIISRFRDPQTEHWIVTASGLSRWGTVAAGEFLTKPEHLEDLAKLAPSDWTRRNLQAVITTKVINGQPGPPRILAVEFW